jgi:hypothetical protein
VLKPPPRLQLSTPLKPVLPEVIMSGSDEAEARSRIHCTIARAKLIKDPEATKEHMLAEVPSRKLSSNGHVSVHDWRGIEIIANVKGP